MLGYYQLELAHRHLTGQFTEQNTINRQLIFLPFKILCDMILCGMIIFNRSEWQGGGNDKNTAAKGRSLHEENL